LHLLQGSLFLRFELLRLLLFHCFQGLEELGNVDRRVLRMKQRKGQSKKDPKR
jgi:hypothetical protein